LPCVVTDPPRDATDPPCYGTNARRPAAEPRCRPADARRNAADAASQVADPPGYASGTSHPFSLLAPRRTRRRTRLPI
jgi:hypothetical protein